jgi:hypothetical protein
VTAGIPQRHACPGNFPESVFDVGKEKGLRRGLDASRYWR